MKRINDIYQAYNNGEYKNKVEYPSQRHFKEGHIFDENQTVKWNKAKVIEENAKLDEKKKAYSSESNRLTKQLHEDLIQALAYENNLPKNLAEMIYWDVYKDKHSSMFDVINSLDETAEKYIAFAKAYATVPVKCL